MHPFYFTDERGKVSPHVFRIFGISLAFVAVVAVIVGLISRTAGSSWKQDDPFKRRETTAQHVFEGYAENLHQMAAMKEKCGHLFEPAQWVGCTNLPSYPPNTSNLDNLRTASSNLGAWLKEVSPIVDAECKDEDPCRRWLEEKKRKESEPPLNVTFEEVDLSP